MKYKIRTVGIKILKCFLIERICFLLGNILISLEMLSIFDKDIRYISLNGVLSFAGVVIMVFAIWAFFQNNISSFHNWIKKHYHYWIILVGAFEVIILYKCKNSFQRDICIIEILLLLILLDYEMSKIYVYNIKKTHNDYSNYVEKPVIGRENLTKTQRETLEQLRELIDKRKSFDSFNIALIGSWGCGKTSITDTLIYEYENEKNKYFILKIGALTLKESQNVVAYVRDYFKDLFRKYEIGIMGRDVAFLTSLAKMLTNSGNFESVLSSSKDNSFLDLEKEKALFTKQVAKLLKISGRKNILLFIEDADRCEEEEQIVKILIEFASIDGIISVVSLDKSKDVFVRPNSLNDITDSVYNYLDKFIHVRMRIGNDDHIEYEEKITQQMLKSFKSLDTKELCFISCDGQVVRNSLFDNATDYQTTEIISPRHFSVNTYNILTVLFFKNLESDSKQFGEYLEELMNKYISHTEEVFPYIQQMIMNPIEEWNIDLNRIAVTWTNLSDGRTSGWLVRLRCNALNLLETICQMYEAMELIWNCCEVQGEILNIEDALDYYMIIKYPRAGRTWEKRKEIPVQFSGLECMKHIVFSDFEFAELDNAIKAGDFELARHMIEEKVIPIRNLYLKSILLNDFITYFRVVSNNYRTFKMQLREAELLKLNYLDYLIKEWQPGKEVKQAYEKMKEVHPVLNTINDINISLSAIINNVLYANYTLHLEKYLCDSELNEGRLYLVNTPKRTIISLSRRNDSVERIVALDIAGNVISELSEEEKELIYTKHKMIWQN